MYNFIAGGGHMLLLCIFAMYLQLKQNNILLIVQNAEYS